MKSSVFIDSGFWIALFDKRDKNHMAAGSNFKPLLKTCRLYLSDFIVFETITYLNCSLKRHDLAIRFLQKLRSSGLTTVTVDENIKADALALFEKYSDKYLSFTDCTSFVIMRRTQIDNYAGFDDHFHQMGFVSAMTGRQKNGAKQRENQ